MADQERLENVNPQVFQKVKEREISSDEMNDEISDEIDNREIFGNALNNIK